MLTTIDLFAGCGGLSEGFEQSGHYKSLAFVEWEKAPCKTLETRLRTKWGYKNASEVVLNFDIQRMPELINGWNDDPVYGSNTGLMSLVGDHQVDLIIGGPPCQAYSIAGRVRDTNGMQDDYRNYLFESFLEVVKVFRPKLFVFENVEGILSAKPGGISIIDRISESFQNVGYSIINDLRKNALVNAADFGVPQNRKRLIIIGVDNHRIKTEPIFALNDFYSSILPAFKVIKKKTVKEALNGLPAILPENRAIKVNGRKVSHEAHGPIIANHIPRYHSKRDQEIFTELAKDKLNGSIKFPNSKSLIDFYFQKTGKRSNFHKHSVLDLNFPSNTIPAHLYKDGLRHIHPDPNQARTITPREAARLQSFDDDFDFIGSIGDQYKMIGNAVPPALAKNISLAVEIFFKKYY